MKETLHLQTHTQRDDRIPTMAQEIAPFLEQFARNDDCWYASVRPDGRPHLAPIWFVWVENAVWMMTQGSSVRARNLAASDLACVSAPDTKSPFILEGKSEQASSVPDAVKQAFLEKYKWDLGTENPEYTFLIRFTPVKAMAWGTEGEGSYRWRYADQEWREIGK